MKTAVRHLGLILGALLAFPAAAAAATQTAHAGDVTARFTYRGSVPAYSGLHLVAALQKFLKKYGYAK